MSFDISKLSIIELEKTLSVLVEESNGECIIESDSSVYHIDVSPRKQEDIEVSDHTKPTHIEVDEPTAPSIEIQSPYASTQTKERRIPLSGLTHESPLIHKYISSYVEDENGEVVSVAMRLTDEMLYIESNIPLDNHMLIIKES